MAELTAKQRRFVEEYLVDVNGAAAARRAGFSVRSAERQAVELLNKTHVAAAIALAMDERARRCGIKADRVLKELARIAFADIGDVFDERGRLRPAAEIPEDARRAVASLETVTRFGGRGEDGEQTGVTCRVRLFDKVAALALLCRHLGLLQVRRRREDCTDRAEKIVAVCVRAAGTRTGS